jgi:histidinol-phosphate/aromatic aminotransferase/cobyric acid decarboxylase-like protein
VFTKCESFDRPHIAAQLSKEAIYADNNAIGRRIIRHVPELAALEESQPGDMYEYVNPNADRGPLGTALRSGLMGLENVTADRILIDGAGLERITRMPALFGAGAVVTVGADFPGYARGRTLSNVRHVEVAAEPGKSHVDPDAVAAAVHGLRRPLVFMTMPFTNPGQSKIGLDAARAVLAKHKTARVVIDAAYRHAASHTEDYVAFALAHPRVLYLNVAAKDLGAAGARVSWMIGAPEIIAEVGRDMLPYTVCAHAARFVSRLVRAPELMARIHLVQREAGDVLRQWTRERPVRSLQSEAPWILLDLGDRCGEIVARLRADHRIFVQNQTGLIRGFEGWARISAGVPDDAERIVSALDELLGMGPLAPNSLN